MQSLERIPDDSEIIEEDENHIHIQNKKYISKGKTLKTINSINKECKDKRINIEDNNLHSHATWNNKTNKSLKASSRLNDRKGSVNMLVSSKIAKTWEIDAFYDANISKSHWRGASNIDSLRDLERICRISKGNAHDRNNSSSRLHDRCKSNVNHNRHFQIK